jgi:hypothetical protein
MDRIISQSKYNRKQHKDFYTFHLLKKSGTIKFLVAIIILMFFVAVTSTFDKDFKIKEETGSIVFSWVMFGFSLSIIPILIITRVNNVVKQETPERIKSTEKIEVTKIKFTRSNDQIEGKSVFGWRDIQSLCETDKYFYIYLSEDNGVFIVKDDIIEGDVETFRKMAEANLKKDKKGKLPYKRYGEVKKQYNAIKKQEKALKKLEKKNQGK